jgi:hypothetical protein
MADDLYIKFSTEDDGSWYVCQQVSHRRHRLPVGSLFYGDWLGSLEGPARMSESGVLPDFKLMQPYGAQNMEATPQEYIYAVRVPLLVQGHGRVWWTASEESHVGRMLVQCREDFITSREALEGMLPLYRTEESSSYENQRRARIYYNPVVTVVAHRDRGTLRLPAPVVVLARSLEGPQGHPDDDLFPDGARQLEGPSGFSSPKDAPAVQRAPKRKGGSKPKSPRDDLNDEIPF